MQGDGTDPGEARGTFIESRATPSVKLGHSRPGTRFDPAWGQNPAPDQGLSPTRCGQGSGRRREVRAGRRRPPTPAPSLLSNVPTCQGKRAWPGVRRWK
jgi:hypothetical protein